MNSRAFYSFYVFVLLAFMGMAIVGYFAIIGRSKTEGVENHLLIQEEILSANLSALTQACLRKYSLKQCQDLEFDLRGYQASVSIKNCKMEVCVVDLVIERISPFSALPLRHTKREVWNLKNLNRTRSD